MMGSLWMDVRGATRALRAAPGFSVLALITLSLGVASVTAVFGVVEGVLLRPLPYPDQSFARPVLLGQIFDANIVAFSVFDGSPF